MLAFGTPEKPI
uniref:Uncharacterized protein n=2 Tax=Mesangiospermae TaxID=1437183 RepID=A0A804U5L1_MUSAM